MIQRFIDSAPDFQLKFVVAKPEDLDEIEGMDGTEIRTEWAGPLRQAVIEKLVKEVGAVMARRANLTQVSSLGL